MTIRRCVSCQGELLYGVEHHCRRRKEEVIYRAGPASLRIEKITAKITLMRKISMWMYVFGMLSAVYGGILSWQQHQWVTLTWQGTSALLFATLFLSAWAEIRR